MGEKLGQNFLVNKEIVKKIVEAADLQADYLVLEIGPGKGILTEELAKKAGKVVAVEIDSSLIAPLKNKFKSQKNVEIVEGDILNFEFQISNLAYRQAGFKINSNLEFQKLFQNLKFKIENCNYKVVANIPYYITAPIIRKFLEAENPPQEMILMVQKEVAERICASPSEIPTKSSGAGRISRGKPGKMSLLAVSVQYYAEPEILFNVPRGNFEPVPEVDSSVIRITPHPSPLPIRGEGDFDKRFFGIVRAGFCAKRKTLANNLANSFHLPKKEVEEKIIAIGFKPTTRAQELSVADWKKLTELFDSY